MGVTEDQLLELPRFAESPVFNERERLALELAVAMAATPAHVAPELRQRLRERFDETELVELAAAIAWENYRARFNRAFDIQPSGFSEGAVCALPG